VEATVRSFSKSDSYEPNGVITTEGYKINLAVEATVRSFSNSEFYAGEFQVILSFYFQKNA